MERLTGVQQKLRRSFGNTLMLVEYFCTNNMRIKRIERELPRLYDCTTAAYPTLVDVKMSHGYSAAISIIDEGIILFCESMSILKPTEEQASEMSELIYEEAYYLNFFELQEFFKRLRKGTYGGFFGSIDSCKVIEKLALFLVDRQRVIQRIKLDREEVNRLHMARIIESRPRTNMPESLRQLIAEVDLSTQESLAPERFRHRCPGCDIVVHGLANHIWCPNCQYLGSPDNNNR